MGGAPGSNQQFGELAQRANPNMGDPMQNMNPNGFPRGRNIMGGAQGGAGGPGAPGPMGRPMPGGGGAPQPFQQANMRGRLPQMQPGGFNPAQGRGGQMPGRLGGMPPQAGPGMPPQAPGGPGPRGGAPPTMRPIPMQQQNTGIQVPGVGMVGGPAQAKPMPANQPQLRTMIGQPMPYQPPGMGGPGQPRMLQVPPGQRPPMPPGMGGGPVRSGPAGPQMPNRLPAPGGAPAGGGPVSARGGGK